MINTDKYEGHTEGSWDKLSEYCPVGSIDKQLIADSPLLLAEVKRLNKMITMLKKNDLWVSQEGWEESDKDDELLVSMQYLICTALEMRGDFND